MIRLLRSNALSVALLLACAAALPGCGRDPGPATDEATTAAADDGFVARTARRALDAARTEMAESNVDIGGKGSGGVEINGVRVGDKDGRTAHLPKAEISPAGDLLIAGKPATIDAAQRELLLAHRAHILAIADAGIAIGVQGARLGADAAKGAIASALSGESDAFEARMKAEGARIEAEARKLCDLLPPLLQSQQSLASALPAFQPYATMTATDIDDCRKDAAEHGGAAVEAAAGETTP
ncbi:YggN family protein [Luteimonas sp. S4-F44]|uniref:YggN family protein n=1 Tax=Luteimonas sp. S4-F44 TaxID=2925842 RepID=UPI001F52BB02|nr:YggN family protein [Luteimonas sp. S4-F44]UNK43793.1 YggN family protein [Luteimonas sp. S4-F44]